MPDIAENFKAIEKKIEKACAVANRDRADIHLVAVSKMQDDEKLDAALAISQRVFGENRVQEAREHRQDRRAQYPELELHLIGPLQTNKVKDAVALFDCIHTVDRENLVDELAKEMAKQSRALPCFIQVNTGDESQKSGVAVEALPQLLDYAAKAGLNITGLMCIPPAGEPAALHFALLKKLGHRHNLKNLSMGMSGDYEKAVQLGATHIRVGSALFGCRN